MNLDEIMLHRRSVRKYTKDSVSKEQIDILLHYAMSGPSAHNKKPWEFYVVTNETKLTELRGVTKYTNIVAPCVIVVCGNMKETLMTFSDFWIQDCSAAIENILLGATSLSLGSLWQGIHPSKKAVKKVKKILGVGNHIIPLGLVSIGHPEAEPKPRDQYDEGKIHYIE